MRQNRKPLVEFNGRLNSLRTSFSRWFRRQQSRRGTLRASEIPSGGKTGHHHQGRQGRRVQLHGGRHGRGSQAGRAFGALGDQHRHHGEDGEVDGGAGVGFEPEGRGVGGFAGKWGEVATRLRGGVYRDGKFRELLLFEQCYANVVYHS